MNPIRSASSIMATIAIALAALVAAPGPVQADEEAARRIIAAGDDLMRGTTAEGVYEMTIINPDWERTLRMRFWEDVSGDRAFVRVLSPPREAGSKTLKLGNEMWAYLPSVEQSIKIPPSMMAQGWMGSDLTNEDIVNGDDYVDEYTHDLVDTTEMDGETIYVIESIPTPEAAVVWGKIRYYARAADALPVLQEFYDEDEGLVRRMLFSEFKSMDGRVIPTRYVVEPLTEEHIGQRTIMVIAEMDFDARIRPGVFTRANLERSR